jgi:hypothetical protein
MIMEVMTQLGLNVGLALDIMTVVIILLMVFIIMATSSLKGLWGPIFKAKYRRHTMAIMDVGGIESQILTYPPGSSNVHFKIKTANGDDEYDWPIPHEEERVLPNGIKYILGSVMFGALFRINKRAEELEEKKMYFGPKAQARIIEDRAKKLTDKLTKDINKPMIMATAAIIIIFALVFAYLILIKAAEYNLAREMITTYQAIGPTTTTLPKLPDL